MINKLKKVIKGLLHNILSRGKEFTDITVLSGPAKGCKLRLDLRKEGSYWLGTYDKWIFDCLPFEELINQGDTIWDCGAYVGYYSAIGRKKVGKEGSVYAFEASSSNFKRLKHMPEINKWNNVHIWNLAIGPEHTTIEFVNNISGSNGPYNLGKKFKQSKSDLDIETVVCCGVDELIIEKGIKAPDFIKFDLESAEEFALHNGDKLFTGKRPVVLLELHGETTKIATGRFLEKYNYFSYMIHDFKTRSNKITNYADFMNLKGVPHQVLCVPAEY